MPYAWSVTVNNKHGGAVSSLARSCHDDKECSVAAARGVKKNRALQTGVPREKLQFVVTPYRDLVAAGVSEAIASRFIMGTALSYARPGSSVDIVLHRCNTIVKRGVSESARAIPQRRASVGEFDPAESSKKTKKTKSKK